MSVSRHAVLLPFAFAAAACLGGCARSSDTFQPRIVLTSQNASGFTRAQDLRLKGYVLDDTGATTLTINGERAALESGSQKIRYFDQKLQPSNEGGQQDFLLVASDAAGNESNLHVEIKVDAKPPEIAITGFERFGRTIRVSGTATDNNCVVEILVDGRRLNSSEGKKVSFYAETQGVYADIEVRDCAGNVATRRVK